jgi:hypothetical protein
VYLIKLIESNQVIIIMLYVYMYVVYFVMYDSVLILLLSYGHHDWFNKVFYTNLLSWIFVVLAHWINNRSRHGMALRHIIQPLSHSDTLYSLWVTQTHYTASESLRHVIQPLSHSDTLYSLWVTQTRYTASESLRHVIQPLSHLKFALALIWFVLSREA